MQFGIEKWNRCTPVLTIFLLCLALLMPDAAVWGATNIQATVVNPSFDTGSTFDTGQNRACTVGGDWSSDQRTPATGWTNVRYDNAPGPGFSYGPGTAACGPQNPCDHRTDAAGITSGARCMPGYGGSCCGKPAGTATWMGQTGVNVGTSGVGGQPVQYTVKVWTTSGNINLLKGTVGSSPANSGTGPAQASDAAANGQIQIADSGTDDGDGLISVWVGFRLGAASGCIASYLDDVSVEFNAVLESVAPSVSGITDTAATVNWTTDENSSSVIEYGTSPGNLNQSGTGRGSTSHSVNLAGLAPGTTYHYRAISRLGGYRQYVSATGSFTTTCTGVWSLLGTVPTLQSTENPFIYDNIRLAGLAMDADGNIYGTANVNYLNAGFFVYNRGTGLFTTTDLKDQAGGAGFNYAGITKLITGCDGNVYALANQIFSFNNDSSRIHAILRLNADGTFTEIWRPSDVAGAPVDPLANTDQANNLIRGMDRGADGNLYWIMMGNSAFWKLHSLYKYDIAGNSVSAWSSDGVDTGSAFSTTRMDGITNVSFTANDVRLAIVDDGPGTWNPDVFRFHQGDLLNVLAAQPVGFMKGSARAAYSQTHDRAWFGFRNENTQNTLVCSRVNGASGDDWSAGQAPFHALKVADRTGFGKQMWIGGSTVDSDGDWLYSVVSDGSYTGELYRRAVRYDASEPVNNDLAIKPLACDVDPAGQVIALHVAPGATGAGDDTILALVATDFAGTSDYKLYSSCTPAAPPTYTPPVDQTICPGGNIVLTVTPTTAVNFQWRKNGRNLTDGGGVSGSNTATLTIAGATAGDAGAYDCIVSTASACSSVISPCATIDLPDCDDTIDCTIDTCNLGVCTNTPDDSACDDSNPLTLDTCNPLTGCENTAACSAPSIITAESRKAHGGAGDFGVGLDTGDVEPRAGGVTQIMLVFDKNVTPADGSIDDGDELTVTSVPAAVISVSNIQHTEPSDTIVFDVSGVQDRSCVTVTVDGIACDAAIALPGATMGTASLDIAALHGDAGNSGKVTSADVNTITSQLGTMTGSTFRSDLNADGVVDGTDVNAAKGATNSVPVTCP